MTASRRTPAPSSSPACLPCSWIFPLLHPPPGPPSPPPEGMPHVVSYNVLKPCKGRISKQSWLVDSGASVHLVNNLSLLHAPTVHAAPIPLQLATSDATGGIIATGSVCLLNQQCIPLWLHHVQCVPSATTNILSVSAALRDGACFATDSMGAFTTVSGPNGWKMPIRAEKGLYYVHDCLSVPPVQRLLPVAAAVKNNPGKTCSMPVRNDFFGTSEWNIRVNHGCSA